MNPAPACQRTGARPPRWIPALPWLFFLSVLRPGVAGAGPWTRDQGHLYLNLNYSGIINAPGQHGVDPMDHLASKTFSFNGALYTQHTLGIYAEVGLVTRWLTATLEGQVYRHNEIYNPNQGADFRAATDGLGDLRLGFWSGLVTKPLRFSVGFLIGLPTGDSCPVPRDNATRPPDLGRDPVPCPEKPLPNYQPPPGVRAIDVLSTAASLPTGDGEWDFELRASLGYSFGQWRRWPLRHYIILEPGIWLRTRSRSPGFGGSPNDEQNWVHSFTYKFEFGLQFPWRVIDRFWFIARIAGVEPFLFSAADVDNRCSGSAGPVGLGNCVTYDAYGFDIAARIYRGLGASLGWDSAFSGRFVPARGNLRAALSYEY